MSQKLALRDLPVFEPLCAATESKLAPIRFQPDDRLELWMHNNNTDFIGRVVGEERDDFTEERNVRPGSFSARKSLHRLPEREDLGVRSWKRQGQWRIAGTDLNAVIVNELWPRDRIRFGGEESEALFNFLVIRFMSQTIRARHQAEFKLNGTVPNLPEEFFDHPDKPLAGYQRVAVSMALRQEATALFMEQGTGKTPVAISTICTEARMHRAGLIGGKPRMMRALIVCPNQVRYNWADEFGNFASVCGKVTVLRGDKARRTGLLIEAIRVDPDSAFTAVIVGYDTLVSDTESFGIVPWDRVVLDESHYIKGRETKRSKKIRAEIRDQSARRMILTGTPIANTLLDVYAQFEFLGHGLSGYSSFKAFRTAFAVEEQVMPGVTPKITGFCNVPLFRERLSRMAFSVTTEEAGINLPDRVRSVREIDMTPIQSEIYAQVASVLVAELTSSRKLVVDHVLTRLLRLAQITAGHVKWDPVVQDGVIRKDAFVEQIPGGNPKIDETLRILQDPQKDPNCRAIVWSVFREDIRALQARMEEEGIRSATYFGDTSENQREEVVRRFNGGDLDVLIGNPATMAEGLNLLGYDKSLPEEEQGPTYCGLEIFFSCNWSATQRAQAEKRAHRRGTKMPVSIVDVICPDTIDEQIRYRVTAKLEHAADMTDVREILQSVLKIDIEV